jgi:hypothetical protein
VTRTAKKGNNVILTARSSSYVLHIYVVVQNWMSRSASGRSGSTFNIQCFSIVIGAPSRCTIRVWQPFNVNVPSTSWYSRPPSLIPMVFRKFVQMTASLRPQQVLSLRIRMCLVNNFALLTLPDSPWYCGSYHYIKLEHTIHETSRARRELVSNLRLHV